MIEVRINLDIAFHLLANGPYVQYLDGRNPVLFSLEELNKLSANGENQLAKQITVYYYSNDLLDLFEKFSDFYDQIVGTKYQWLLNRTNPESLAQLRLYAALFFKYQEASNACRLAGDELLKKDMSKLPPDHPCKALAEEFNIFTDRLYGRSDVIMNIDTILHRVYVNLNNVLYYPPSWFNNQTHVRTYAWLLNSRVTTEEMGHMRFVTMQSKFFVDVALLAGLRIHFIIKDVPAPSTAFMMQNRTIASKELKRVAQWGPFALSSSFLFWDFVGGKLVRTAPPWHDYRHPHYRDWVDFLSFRERKPHYQLYHEPPPITDINSMDSRLRHQPTRLF